MATGLKTQAGSAITRLLARANPDLDDLANTAAIASSLNPLGLVQTVAGRASFKTDHKTMKSLATTAKSANFPRQELPHQSDVLGVWGSQ